MTEVSAQTPNSASTPSSTAPTSGLNGENSAAGKASKDKACPFCNQPFTSSSLGRHLDLYIKPKNPKPPDGVHDVEQIKQLRGGITRRQPRSSHKPKRESENPSERGTPGQGSGSWRRRESGSVARTNNGPASTAGRAMADEREGSMHSPINPPGDGKMRTVFNSMNWQATGVINNLPPQEAARRETFANQIRRQEHLQESTSTPRDSMDGGSLESLTKLTEERETGRAAQMALREVLDSVEAAK